jgi:MFS family permease
MKSSNMKIKIGIMAASSVQLAIVGVAAAVAPMMEHFTGISPTLVMSIVTIPSLVCIPVQLFVGANASKFGKKKPLLLGLVILSLCGLTPAIFEVSFPALMSVSVGIGIGVGLLMPTATGLITDHFSGAEAGSLMGKQSAFINLGAMILSTAGGFLSTIGWRNTFFIYIYAILMAAIVIVCIPKDKSVKKPVPGKQAEKPKLSKEVFIMSALVIGFGLCFGVAQTNNSLFVSERELGESHIAGLAGSITSGFGILVGLLYGIIVKGIKKWALPVAFLSGMAGLFIISAAHNVPLFWFGAGFMGVGLSLAMPTGLFRVASSVKQNASTLAISIFLSSVNIGLFISPLVLNPISHTFMDGSAGSRYILGGFVLIVLAALAFVHVRKDGAGVEENNM